MTRTTEFYGEQAILLDNENLEAVILPERGGKVASLLVKKTGMELLYQNTRKTFTRAQFGSNFGDFEACGFDDAFPTVDEEIVEVGGKKEIYPDHGEIWSASFVVDPPAMAKENAVNLCYYSRRLNYDYQKRFELKGNRLCCRYTIRNNAKVSLPYVWTMHCLMNLTPNMRFIFPAGTKQVQNVFSGSVLKGEEKIYLYPEDETEDGWYRFDRLPDEGSVKYYAVGRVKEGVCGYDYPETNTSVRLHYDPEKLPYLGCWITAGGYRGDKNCALEPCTGYYDSVGKAKRLVGSCAELAPGEMLDFTIEIEAYSINNQLGRR